MLPLRTVIGASSGPPPPPPPEPDPAPANNPSRGGGKTRSSIHLSAASSSEVETRLARVVEAAVDDDDDADAAAEASKADEPQEEKKEEEEEKDVGGWVRSEKKLSGGVWQWVEPDGGWKWVTDQPPAPAADEEKELTPREAAFLSATSEALAPAPPPPPPVGVCRILLQTRDKMGNPCKMGGANVSCGLADLDYVSAVEDAAAEAEMESTVYDHGDGTYLLEWRSAVAGTYNVCVKVDGVHVVGSPTSLEIRDPLEQQRLLLEREQQHRAQQQQGQPSNRRGRPRSAPQLKLGRLSATQHGLQQSTRREKEQKKSILAGRTSGLRAVIEA